MPDPIDPRVAVYIDFDNIVISRYDQLWGRGRFHSDRVRDYARADADPEMRERVEGATVDLSAILDYASSFGTIVLSRAYADWSMPVNAGYRQQLLGRAVDLVQLFPSTRGMKNGADIRLAVDVVEDLFRLPDLTHVVIIAGDSDYIALAQRAKRLGKFVVGMGVAGSTSKSLAAACDEFADYDALPGVTRPAARPARAAKAEEAEAAKAQPKADEKEAPKSSRSRRKPAKADGGAASGAEPKADATSETVEQPASAEPAADEQAEAAPKRRRRATSGTTSMTPAFIQPGDPEPEADDDSDDARQDAATSLLERALRLGHDKGDDDWLHSNVVKAQMKRMDPSFNERSLGAKSFSDFVSSRGDLVAMKEDGQARLLRLRSLGD